MTAVGKMLTTAAIASMAASANAQTPAVKHVVLVHGSFETVPAGAACTTS